MYVYCIHIIHLKNTYKDCKRQLILRYYTSRYDWYSCIRLTNSEKKSDWAVSSPCKFESTASGKWASFFPISQAVDLVHWFSAGLSKRSDPSGLIETPRNRDLPLGPPQGRDPNVPWESWDDLNQKSVMICWSNLLPSQTKWIFLILKMKGITAVELV